MGEVEHNTGPGAVKSKPVRVALIASAETVSDYLMFLGHLLVGLTNESIATALVCPAGYDVECVVSPAVEVMRYPAVELPFLGHLNKKILVQQLEKFKPTVLHCLCEKRAALVRKLSRRMGVPYVLSVNSLQKRAGRLSISSRRCAKIIVPAESIESNLRGVYPRLAERVAQIRMGTFVAETSRCFSERSRLACMVTSAAAGAESDFAILLGAVRRLVIDGYEFMLVVTGGGRGEQQLRRMLRESGLWQIVTITPRLECRHWVLSAGDIFIQPAVSSAFNPFLLEAMGVGTAVAGCKGGVDDLIIEGRTAVVFDPDDELSIYSTLQKLLNSRELARKLAGDAQAYLRENCRVSVMISSILKIYGEAEEWLRR